MGGSHSFMDYCSSRSFYSNRSTFEEIPSMILWDILLRLPTKACLNCKLVYKEWYQIITSPEFAGLRSSQCPYNTILLCGKMTIQEKNLLILDLGKSPKDDEMGNLDVGAGAKSLIRFKSEVNTPHQDLYVVNECNGLVCLKSWQQWSPYIICNLLTGQQVIVKQRREPFYNVEVYGLGRCPMSHNFKVLRILGHIESNRYIAEIQTLGTREWRFLGRDPLFYVSSSRAFLRDSLHVYSFRDKCIWSFNFGNEQFLPVPIHDDMDREIDAEVSVFGSCLCLRAMSENCSQCEIWIMKEYGVKDSWVKYFFSKVDSYCMPLLHLGTREMLVSYRMAFVLEHVILSLEDVKEYRFLGFLPTKW